MKIFFQNFGCKVNSFELEAIKQSAIADGHSEVFSPEQADAAVINTCAVTGEAARKCKNAAKSVRLHNPHCCVAVMGCLPQAFTDESNTADYFDVVVGSKNKGEVIGAIEKFLSDGKKISLLESFSVGDKIEPLTVSKSEDRTRAVLKIEDGCDMYCSYCIIPYARGHVRSKSLEDIRREAGILAENGHKEIVLVGINLCCYGKDLGLRLSDAVKAVNMIDGIERIRLGSLEPEMITDDDIKEFSKCKKLCGHFHLSLQSGCDKTLKSMRRKYLTNDYLRIVNGLRATFENCSITTDVMVGFPGETEEDFLKSLEFVKSIGFASVHVFPYSARTGTAAAKYPDQIPAVQKRKRAETMRKQALLSQQDFLNSQVGTRQKVIFERESDPEYHQGHTENYTLVKVLRKNPKNKLHKHSFYVRIKKADGNFCIGEIEDEI